MSSYFLFSSYHNTKLQRSDKNISTHTLVEILNPIMKLIPNNNVFCCFSLYPTVQIRNQGAGQNCARIDVCRAGFLGRQILVPGEIYVKC